jgi:predicted dehydrogenase
MTTAQPKSSLMDRRTALRSTLQFTGASVLLHPIERAVAFQSANERPRIGVVGTGSRWCQKATGIDRPYGSAPDFAKYGDYVAVCDADTSRREMAAGLVKQWHGQTPKIHADYRAILEDPSIDIVHITTPDHWHAKIAIEAM